MFLVASDSVIKKMKTIHNVDFMEVEEAFYNHGNDPVLIDDREENRSDPKTIWFIDKTARGKVLKVVIVPYVEEGFAVVRTAYEPDELEVMVYEKNI